VAQHWPQLVALVLILVLVLLSMLGLLRLLMLLVMLVVPMRLGILPHVAPAKVAPGPGRVCVFDNKDYPFLVQCLTLHETPLSFVSSFCDQDRHPFFDSTLYTDCFAVVCGWAATVDFRS
jgi:hypothetical protein